MPWLHRWDLWSAIRIPERACSSTLEARRPFIGWKRFFWIAATLSDADNPGGIVAFENRAVFGKRKRAGGIFCWLPVGIIGAAFNVVNHLAVKLKGNT